MKQDRSDGNFVRNSRPSTNDASIGLRWNRAEGRATLLRQLGIRSPGEHDEIPRECMDETRIPIQKRKFDIACQNNNLYYNAFFLLILNAREFGPFSRISTIRNLHFEDLIRPTISRTHRDLRADFTTKTSFL